MLSIESNKDNFFTCISFVRQSKCARRVIKERAKQKITKPNFNLAFENPPLSADAVPAASIQLEQSIFLGNHKLDFSESDFWDGIFTVILQVRFPRVRFLRRNFHSNFQEKYSMLFFIALCNSLLVFFALSFINLLGCLSDPFYD